MLTETAIVRSDLFATPLWIEQKKVVNLTSTGRKISQHFGDIEPSKPLGIASWSTSAAVREIKIRRVSTPDSPTE